MLDAVAEVLRLDDHERRHLYMLAGASPPRRQAPVHHDVDPVLIRLLDTWLPNPAQVMDRHWYVIAANDAAQFVLDMEGEYSNALFCAFLNPTLRADPEGWAITTRTAVAAFRAEMSHYPDDTTFAAIADELAAISPEFVELWSNHDVQPVASHHQAIAHPIAGTLTFDIGLLRAKTKPDITVALYFRRAGHRNRGPATGGDGGSQHTMTH